MYNYIKYFVLIISLCNCISILKANAATINATSCSRSAVQSAINSASDGDIVSIPGGSCTWTGAVNWSNKNITVQGAGIDTTVITASGGMAFDINDDSKSYFRVSNMTINMPVYNGGGGSAYIHIQNNTGTTRSGWRIDHIRMNSTINNANNANHPIEVIGLTWGVIDNCIFDANGDGEQTISHYAYVNNVETMANIGRLSWENVPLGLGTDSAVYVEDCVFNHGAYPMSAVNDTQYGGRMVIRHNKIYNSMIMTHSAWEAVRGGMKLEVYGNLISAAVHAYRPALIRSGTGVFYNNTIIGNYDLKALSIDNQRSCGGNGSTICDGTQQTYDGNTPGEQGWPCEDQPGVGSGPWKNQVLEPWYAWNNGSNSTCQTGGVCNNSISFVPNGACPSVQVQSDRDYYNNGSTPKLGYTPYTYPHPLRTLESPGNFRFMN